MRNRNRNRRSRKQNAGARDELFIIPRPLETSHRRLTFGREVQFESWTNLGTSHLRSDYVPLQFALSNFPGYSSLSSVFDQVAVSRATWFIVATFAAGTSTISARPRVLTIHSTYDPDGGSINPVDILSRQNLETRSLNFCFPTAKMAGVPGMVNDSTKQILKNVFLDISDSENITFHSHKLVCDTVTASLTPSDIVRVMAYCTVDLRLRGLR